MSGQASTGTAQVSRGLSEAEAARRLAERGRPAGQPSSRSYASIIRANTLNIPNAILFVFGVLTIAFASWRDALFLGILVSNIAIGSFQEIRSKRELDRLAALVAPDAVVVREGADRRVPVEEVVAGDLVRLAGGDQVVADGTVVSADGLALDEANLTGESEPVVRAVGEPVWSGSFAVEGAALFEATAVGEESRAAKLTATARAFRHPRSPLERANDRLLLWIIAAAVPLAVGLTASVLARVGGSEARVQAITAGLVNLVPEGLILLISLTAAVSAFKIARRGVLAQQLNAVESLASVDVVCTDKTGTLTEPTPRVLALGRGEGPLPAGGANPPFPEDVRALGLVVLAERLRPNAAETVAFFSEQQVALKVLSGDAPATAGAIAHDAGVPGSAAALNGEELPSEPAALRDAVLEVPAVGRISPDGKRAVVGALSEAGRYVAMVGDGVNDVPALKEARLAIAQGSGTQMARSVADLVLVRDDFAAVPGMVGEGRQILRNIQRVARLFVTKTVFTAVMVLAVGIPTATYPLLPRQFTIASTVTIGIPAFLLALAPSSGPWRPERFLRSVASFAIPAGIAIGLGVVAGYLLARYGFDLGLTRSRTVATGIVVVCGLAVVVRLERRRGRARLVLWGLCAVMLGLFALALVIPFLRHFYELATPTGESVAAWALGTVIGVGGMVAALRVVRV